MHEPFQPRADAFIKALPGVTPHLSRERLRGGTRRQTSMVLIEFIGGHGSPQAGKPVYVNPETVGIVTEGAGSKPGRPVTAIQCGGFPVLVAGSVDETLAALTG